MSANGISGQLQFQGMGKRRVEAAFDAGRTTSDGGVLALRELAVRMRLFATFAACFADHRKADLIEHSVEELVGQRVLGIACGYEDLNDHDTLRDDPAFAVAVGKKDPTGENRKRDQDRGHGLAGKSTLNRLELTPADASAASRYNGQPARNFKEFRYRTLQSWTRERRVIGKAERISGKANPRFILTSLSSGKPRALYEKLYCARGDMENRIKAQHLAMFADRTSTHTMRASQMRLYFASVWPTSSSAPSVGSRYATPSWPEHSAEPSGHAYSRSAASYGSARGGSMSRSAAHSRCNPYLPRHSRPSSGRIRSKPDRPSLPA